MDMDWHRVMQKLHEEAKEHAKRAEDALKDNNPEGSLGFIVVGNVLESLAEALYAGIKDKGD